MRDLALERKRQILADNEGKDPKDEEPIFKRKPYRNRYVTSSVTIDNGNIECHVVITCASCFVRYIPSVIQP